MSSKRAQKAMELIQTAGKMSNTDIYDVEISPSLLKVFIDRQSKLDLKTCERFMRSLLFLLQSEGMDNWECEVSTPGLERALKKDWHFRSAVGQTIKVHTSQPVLRQSKKSKKSRQSSVLTGQLCKYQGQTLLLKDGGSKVIVPLNIITKAHILFEIPKKKGPKEKKT